MEQNTVKNGIVDNVNKHILQGTVIPQHDINIMMHIILNNHLKLPVDIIDKIKDDTQINEIAQLDYQSNLQYVRNMSDDILDIEEIQPTRLLTNGNQKYMSDKNFNSLLNDIQETIDFLQNLKPNVKNMKMRQININHIQNEINKNYDLFNGKQIKIICDLLSDGLGVDFNGC
jgi:hypothetical protein